MTNYILSKTDVKYLDAILQHIIINPALQVTDYYIKDLLKIPLPKAELYYKIIHSYRPEIVSRINDRGEPICIYANDYTLEFLSKEKGFLAIYERQEEEKLKDEEDRELQRINWKTTTETSKEAVKLSKWSFWLSAGAIIISILTLIFK